MKKTVLYFLIVGILFAVAGCHKKQVQEKPSDLIPKKVIVNVIAECYLIESYIQVLTDTFERCHIPPFLYKEMFNRYGITRPQFISSINYYLGDEDQAEKLLTEASVIVAAKHKEYAKADSAALAESLRIEVEKMQASQ
ncbi:MAG: DUF4296 domain-containing protein [Bacteroidales bacterium]|nr:DUF4296 domain-containing protein [Bacteroidales bacterium]